MIMTALLFVAFNTQNVFHTKCVIVFQSPYHIWHPSLQHFTVLRFQTESQIFCPQNLFCHHVISYIKTLRLDPKISIMRSTSTVHGIAVRRGMLMFPDNRTEERTDGRKDRYGAAGTKFACISSYHPNASSRIPLLRSSNLNHQLGY